MTPESMSTKHLSSQYHKVDDEGRERLFEDLYTYHYHGPRTIPDDLANALKELILSLDVLPTIAGTETMEIVVVQEICFGMQRFCLRAPPGVDYAWNATLLFISKLGQMPLEPDEFDAHTFVKADFKYWIAEFPSDDRCNMDNTTSNLVQDSDASVINMTQNHWDNDSEEQLDNLAINRNARKRCIVNKVIAARALRDGYAPHGPQNTGFPGACELRFVELALQCRQGSKSPGAEHQTSGDAIAATFLLRACAKSLLSRLPDEGCSFHELWEIPPVVAREEGRRLRLDSWKNALERIVVNEQSPKRDFALTCYAGMAINNLNGPRDETSEELFSWNNIVF